MLRHQNLVPLSHQHHDALMLCVLIRRSLQADGSAGNVQRQAARAVAFSTTEGENHFGLEEQILFPLIESTLGGHPLLAALRQEHAELRALSAKLGHEPVRQDLDAFVALLQAHVRKEESELFHDVQDRLPPGVFDAAGKTFREQVVQVCVTD